MGISVETPEVVAPPKDRTPLAPLLRPGGWIFVLLLVWLYHSILYRLAVQWWKDPNFSHGFFVPAFALFVLWQDRHRIRSIKPAPSWWGLPIILFSLVILVFGVLGVELFTARSSFLFLLAGLIILFRGWPLFRAVLFPWAFSFLMIPLPAIIMQRFTFPLQLFASKLATQCLRLASIPVLREGNLIELPHITLEVAVACSGIRSLVSLLTLAIIYGYLMENRNRVRVALAVSAVPIAVLANVFRIFATGVLAERWDPDKAMGFFHEFQGWLIFVVALILLFALHRLIDLIWKPSPAGKPTPRDTETSPPPPQNPLRAPNSRARFAVAALFMLAAATLLQARSQEVLPPRQPLSSLPMQIDSWTGTDEPIPQDTLEILGNGEFLQRVYVSANTQEQSVDLFIAYYPTQKFGDTLHSPLNCLYGAGFTPIRRELVQLSFPQGAFPVNRLVIVKGVERSLVLYWFQAHGRVLASEYSAKYYLIADSIRLHRSDGALVRLTTPMLKDESPDDAQARMMKLGSQFLPLVDKSIPR